MASRYAGYSFVAPYSSLPGEEIILCLLPIFIYIFKINENATLTKPFGFLLTGLQFETGLAESFPKFGFTTEPMGKPRLQCGSSLLVQIRGKGFRLEK